jgi:para-nitrobenzyl esterase
VLGEFGLSKSQVEEMMEVSVARPSEATAEVMKKMPPLKSSLRKVYDEHDWGPTVDGRILPRHPFDPEAPEISANVPLLEDR